MSLTRLIDSSTKKLKATSSESISAIQRITQKARVLAMNALIESAHAGDAGAGFRAVANEVKSVADEIEQLSNSLKERLESSVDELRNAVGDFTADERSQRLIDMALNMVEIIDRNLYERTCDVRWWATERALIECLQTRTTSSQALACERLAVILSSYTVYLDLWLCDLDGNVVANGRPDRFEVSGESVRSSAWFDQALDLRSGDEFTVADIGRSSQLGGSQTATYAAQVRQEGSSGGKMIGVLAIHFDWAPQAATVVQGARIGAESGNRALLLDAERRVIAASDGLGILKERYDLGPHARSYGSFVNRDGALVAFHATPGYETYRGLGWTGVIIQR